ncbi:hypothetical protein IAD21_00876 [Abditibacteriota bacterium]|nr:hypothetical protein IAD21_00876 [Abditibacteriota bacterium]
MAEPKTKKDKNQMSTLTVRIMERRKSNLDEAALQLGFTRMKEGELRGDISALLNQIAEALPSKSADEIRRFLMERPQ